MNRELLAKVNLLLVKAANDSCPLEEARTAAFLAARLIQGNHLVVSEQRQRCVRCGHNIQPGQEVHHEAWGGTYHAGCPLDF